MENSSTLAQEEILKLMALKPGLSVQSYDQITEVASDSKFVMSRQATMNIGTIGHVSHGKTTVVKAISGVDTIKFMGEKIRNITIKLGYANAKIYKCPVCPKPQCFKSFGSEKEDLVLCDNEITDENGKKSACGHALELIRHISFVDCPGHDILMATMLTGAAVMDAAMLLIAGDMQCPQPQTSEHLAAVDIMQLNHIIILQNKVDLIFAKEGAAQENFQQIKEFIKGTKAEKSPIIPISAQFKYNIDVVLQYMVDYIPLPLRDFSSDPRFMVIRSFDVNKPGYTIDKLKGGVAGGSVIRGVLKVGQEVEIRPGIITKSQENGEPVCRPIISTVISLNAEHNELLYAIPGGLIGVGLTIDPFLTKGDRLVGNVMGHPGSLPNTFIELEINYYLLMRLVGVKSSGEGDRVSEIAKGETLMINVGSTSTGCDVLDTSSKNNKIKVRLLKPVCTSVKEKVALSRRINKKFRLIGWGHIAKGHKAICT